MTITFGQNDLHLLPEGAAFDAVRGLLFVSDLHLGKTAVFRDAGLPLPEGPDERILIRLADLIAKTKAKSLVVLGDVFHAKSPGTQLVVKKLAHLRREVPLAHRARQSRPAGALVRMASRCRNPRRRRSHRPVACASFSTGRSCEADAVRPSPSRRLFWPGEAAQSEAPLLLAASRCSRPACFRRFHWPPTHPPRTRRPRVGQHP